jgi:serine/threonine-protein kinase
MQLGPYTLLSPIGAGGMGEVWKARDTRLDRIVAVKRLNPEHRKRFEQEAKLIAALNHPNICQLYDVGPDYLVMEYIEGKPLSGPLAVDDAQRLGMQIAAALIEAHRRGILHRDLKPANIMITLGGTAKLLDFGLAIPTKTEDANLTRNTMAGAIVGTAAYLSPEQAEGREIDERSDIFSFGAVLYEMLSGSQAFGGTSTAQILSAVLRDDPRPIQTPSALDGIIRRCLAKAASQRYQTMLEVRTALEQASRGGDRQEPSIAVLPFANMSGDKENEYFSDGLAEEIINALAHVPGLKVTARTSAFAFRGKEQDIRKIAETLGVRTILEGSVRRAGNRIRVTAQLINAEDGYHLWSERYDREMADVFAMQDEIARSIAETLQGKLQVAATPQRRYTPKLAAYDAYLKARHYNVFSASGLETVKQYLEQAIAIDPNFALAYCELGMNHHVLSVIGLRPAREVTPLARSAAQQALEIDPVLPEAHALMGAIAVMYDFEPIEGERQFRLAMARDPVPPTVLDFYGFFYLFYLGRTDDAVLYIERALREDPLNLVFRTHLMLSYDAAGKHEEASRESRQILEFNNKSPICLANFASPYLQKGLYTEALPWLEKAYGVSSFALPNIAGVTAAVRSLTGDEGGANELLNRLSPPEAYGVPRGRALFHIVRGEFVEAKTWVDKAIDQRDPTIIPLLRGGFTVNFRSSPQWREIARKVNLHG